MSLRVVSLSIIQQLLWRADCRVYLLVLLRNILMELEELMGGDGYS